MFQKPAGGTYGAKVSETAGTAGVESAISLVDCTVRVSPTLARSIRKCASTEAGGASAHDALLASAGVRAGEIEALRDQKGQCDEELSHAREHAAQLQRALDHAQDIIAHATRNWMTSAGK